MKEPNEAHAPSAAFVDALEHELRRELRTGPTSAYSLRPVSGAWARSNRIAAGLLLTVGLVLGAGGQLAYAQVQQSAQRTTLELEKQVEQKMKELQLERAKELMQVAEQQYATGSTKRQAVLDAEAEMKRALMEIQRITLDLEEVRRTAMPPRNDLWAPRVGERDFVAERLRIEAASAQEQLRLAQSHLEGARTAFRAGSQTANELSTVEELVARNEAVLERAARKLRLREQALTDRLSMERVAQELQLSDAQTDYRMAQKLVTLAEARLEVVKRNAATGGATALDVKRAELDALERRDELERLARQLKAIQKPE